MTPAVTGGAAYGKKQEEYWENSLSDAYENLNGEPRLELKVITLNINEGHNKELLEQCQTLREYAQYVAKVRKYAKEMSLDEAVERTVNECIQEGILKSFLQANRNEVIAMSIFEYDKEEEEKKLRKAEYEAGIQEGIQEGIQVGRQEGRQEGIQETKKEIALQMLKAGVSGEEIVRFTGYTVEQLQKIKETEI